MPDSDGGTSASASAPQTTAPRSRGVFLVFALAGIVAVNLAVSRDGISLLMGNGGSSPNVGGHSPGVGASRAFEALDQNRDGVIDANEWKSAGKRVNWDPKPTVPSKSESEQPRTPETLPTAKKSRANKPKEKKAKSRRDRHGRPRPPPYPTYPPPHSPRVAAEPVAFPDYISRSKSRQHYVFTVDNRDVRGKGYRPFVAAANQVWSTVIPEISTEKHKYIYLRSNLSCSLKNCPTFPGNQVNKHCCTGPPDLNTGNPIPVHPSWMDLKGILYMLKNVMKDGDIGVYLDSDAHFDANKGKTFRDSFYEMLPEFMNGTRPVAVVRDRSFWTAKCHVDFGGPYTMDANSGIIMFTKNRAAEAFMQRLWESALYVSPQEKRMEIPLNYQFGWPHEQERLSWFASTPVENVSVTYIQRQGWHKELPWCFQAICHRNFDKMPYIEEYVKESITGSARCDLGQFRRFCQNGKVDPARYDDLVESLLDNVEVVPM